jgi:hypothetical protein
MNGEQHRHINVKVFKASTVCACGKPAEIVANDVRGDLMEQQFLATFCAKCAPHGIAQLPVCNWLQIGALTRPGAMRETSVRRKYKVPSLNEHFNRAIVVIIDGSNQFLCGLTLNVRHDTLSPASRAIDAVFEIIGTPLEIELLEHSAR